ncbi:hypothetical protein GCM10009854_00690 [Saccharopolyspora halophila]|uniref:DUF3558 domain-containing protein n=1 Tax=Saccharopolyspora halophila TaxID=405551 RepID=A0ABN3FGU8_9PSEU
MRRVGVAVPVIGLLAGLGMTGCTGQVPGAGAPPSGATTTEEGTTTATATPSLTREVPPQQRERLGDLSGQRICGLISPGELEELAFAVAPGRPRQAGEPPVRGCEFAAPEGSRSVVLGAQPEGYGTLGTTEVELGRVAGTQELRAADCTVFVPVRGATLQVSVATGQADDETCQNAAEIADYLLPGLVI